MGRIIVQTEVTNPFDGDKSVRCGRLADTGAGALIFPVAWKERFGSCRHSEPVELQSANREVVRGEACCLHSIQAEPANLLQPGADSYRSTAFQATRFPVSLRPAPPARSVAGSGCVRILPGPGRSIHAKRDRLPGNRRGTLRPPGRGPHPAGSRRSRGARTALYATAGDGSASAATVPAVDPKREPS